MNEMDVINTYVRELKLATFRENTEPYAQVQFGSSGDVWAISDDCLKRK